MTNQSDVTDFNESNPWGLSQACSDSYGEQWPDFRELRTATHQDSEAERPARASRPQNEPGMSFEFREKGGEGAFPRTRIGWKEGRKRVKVASDWLAFRQAWQEALLAAGLSRRMANSERKFGPSCCRMGAWKRVAWRGPKPECPVISGRWQARVTSRTRIAA